MITVIVPIYNSEEYLDRCIQSVLSQTYTNWELLLVDDGSTDRSKEVITPYLKDERIKLYSKKNGGVSSARNYGIYHSKGEYLCFLDSDDWLCECALDVMLNIMLKESADCLVIGIHETHGVVWAPEYDKNYDSLTEFNNDFSYWLNTELLSPCTNKVYKKQLLISSFPEDMSYGEDLVFSLNYLARCNRISFIKDALYQHEVYNVSSITHSFNITRFSDIEIIQDCVLDFTHSKDEMSIYSKYIKDCIHLVRACLKATHITYGKKKQILCEWLSQSYFRMLKLSYYPMHWKDKVLMFFIKKQCVGISYLIVNGKSMLKHR